VQEDQAPLPKPKGKKDNSKRDQPRARDAVTFAALEGQILGDKARVVCQGRYHRYFKGAHICARAEAWELPNKRYCCHTCHGKDTKELAPLRQERRQHAQVMSVLLPCLRPWAQCLSAQQHCAYAHQSINQHDCCPYVCLSLCLTVSCACTRASHGQPLRVARC
jgi:hypothetical protein